jgi:hypothetical protein
VQTSRAIAAPGVRTDAHPGWRERLASAIAITAGSRRLTLLGALGSSLRGTILILLAPIIVLPTQVEVRGLLGNNLGSSGFSDSFWVLVGGAAFTSTVLVALATLAIAATERASFETINGRLAPAIRNHVLLRLFAVQLLTVVAVVACAIPLALAVGHVTYDEIIRPTSAASIYARVLAAIGQPLFGFAASVLVIELLSALTTREVLARVAHTTTFAGSPRLWLFPALLQALTRPLRSPIRTIATATMGWLAFLAALAPAVWLIGLAWTSVRSAFLTSVSLADLRADVGMLIVASGLALAFAVGLTLAGLASAFRSALWTVDRLS